MQKIRKGDEVVVITGRDATTLTATAQELSTPDVTVLPVVCDVSKPEDIQRAVAEIIEKCGHIDVLVNVAGVNIRKPSEAFTPEQYDFVVDINLKGAFFMSKSWPDWLSFQPASRTCKFSPSWVNTQVRGDFVQQLAASEDEHTAVPVVIAGSQIAFGPFKCGAHFRTRIANTLDRLPGADTRLRLRAIHVHRVGIAGDVQTIAHAAAADDQTACRSIRLVHDELRRGVQKSDHALRFQRDDSGDAQLKFPHRDRVTRREIEPRQQTLVDPRRAGSGNLTRDALRAE